MNKRLTALSLLLTLGGLTTVHGTPTTPAPPPPPLSTTDGAVDGNNPVPTEEGSLETEITIVEKEGQRMEEYRVSGRLYMVKVTPVIGPAYYLIDRDGDGQLETRMDSLKPDFLVPQWVLFHW